MLAQVAPSDLFNMKERQEKEEEEEECDGDQWLGEGLKWKRTVNVRPVQLLVKAPTSVQLSGAHSASFGVVRPLVLQLPLQQPL